MRANELRSAFCGFFADRGHTIVPSASLIPHDPTVLFTIAGMVPFKPFFVGEEIPPYKRATSVQKCVRAGGKQNDIDEVGRTSRHLTFFEMLGNFSFGDYFKADAIPYAWEFFTEVLKLDPERLWVTVHISDDEAEAIWRDVIGVPPERIQRLDDDNFWRMGDVGPCGPCSEIFWDKGVEYGADGGPAHGGEERFVEIWNLVFMQYEQLADGSMVPLPKPSIDTGSGLERVLSVVQGVDSVWELDEMRSLIALVEQHSAVAYGAAERTDVSLRIVAEHARTVTFLISDGVFPSNEDRGYVLRRILRRAVRHAYLLGIETIVLADMVDAVVGTMGADYPDIVRNHEFVRNVVQREEERFRETLRSGSSILDNELDALDAAGVLAGAVAFQLHDTYGFPLELTEEIASERGFSVDRAGFDEHMGDQRTRARDARKARAAAGDSSGFIEVMEQHGSTVFVGRELNEATGTILAIIGDDIVVDITPFYAESGGQVGDMGAITTATGTATVIDTVYGSPGLVRHVVGSIEGDIEVGQTATLSIDVERRNAIRRNHTATHILHWALRKVLGDHVKQQGSMVGPDRLRFDFSHYQAVTPDEIRAIEDLANHEILSNPPVRHYESSKAEALEAGAIAFFGDKYGDTVRVLEAGLHSVELCGGTHVSALGDIGPTKIISEGSIGSNMRRIEALTGFGPIDRLRGEEAKLASAAAVLGVPPDDLEGGIAKRLGELSALRDEVSGLRRQVAQSSAGSLVDQAVDGIVIARVEATTRDEVRDLALGLRDRPGIRAVVLGSSPGGKGVALVAAVRPDSGLNAGDLIADALALVGGGGGKGAEIATAGGRNPEGLDAALEHIRAALLGV